MKFSNSVKHKLLHFISEILIVKFNGKMSLIAKYRCCLRIFFPNFFKKLISDKEVEFSTTSI